MGVPVETSVNMLSLYKGELLVHLAGQAQPHISYAKSWPFRQANKVTFATSRSGS